MRRRITTGEFSVLKTAPIGHKLYKRKNKFYNPVWQNSTQVLKEYLGEAVEKIPIYSIIVFGNQADFKFKEPFTKARVIKRRELLSVIKNTPGDDSVSHSQRQKIRQLLSRLDIEDKKERKRQAKKHVADIKKNLERKEKKTWPQSTNVPAAAAISSSGKAATEHSKAAAITRNAVLLQIYES